MFWIALGIFCISLFLFLFEWIDKTIVALLGAIFLILFGVLDFEEVIEAIDFETIVLLMGLMMLVSIAQHSGLFSWLNVKIADKSGGNPLTIFLLFILLAFVTSTILDNVTVVLLIIPIALALSKGLGLNSKLFIISLALFSNIAGALTLIGDPPNVIIGIKVGLTFNQFIQNLWIPIFSMSVLIIAYILILYWKDLKPISNSLPRVLISNLIIERIKYQFSIKKLSSYLIIITILAIIATIIAFVLQPHLGIPIGVLGFSLGLILTLFVFRHIPFSAVLHEIHWDSLLFFMALFVQVGALEKVGFLEMITNIIVQFSDNYALLLLIVVWGIGLCSAVINNIPFVALMIPVIYDLQAQMSGQPHLDLLWWALALGACLGGNATIIGSSAGVIAVDIARKNGIKISFFDFMKVGVPVTLISLSVASVYLLARLYL
ncbi:MAG: citrate transporter family protein [uncultured bacterium]|nr:MAG: citrate transporter family protein [uncultured bacterium]KKT76234.1 MAG: Citrate transporter [Candidatus Peregrinibacteria bacterium GW2011_GWA2_44_7]